MGLDQKNSPIVAPILHRLHLRSIITGRNRLGLFFGGKILAETEKFKGRQANSAWPHQAFVWLTGGFTATRLVPRPACSGPDRLAGYGTLFLTSH